MNNNKGAAASETEHVLRFELDPVDSKYGRAAGFVGEIPFLGSADACKENYERIVGSPVLNQVLSEIVSCYRDLWPQFTDDEIFERMRMDVVAAAIMFGCDRADDPRFRFVAHMSAVGWTVDDVADGDGDAQEENRKQEKKAAEEEDKATKSGKLKSEYRIVRQIFADNQVPVFDCLPNLSFKYTAMRDALKTFMRIAHETISDFPQRYGHGLRDEMVCYMESVILNRGHKSSPTSRYRTREAYSELVHYLYGIPLVLEVYTLVYEVDVPDWIRRDLLFKMVYNRTCDVWATVNAVLGLAKDIRDKQLDSRIFIEVLYGGRSLQDAIDGVYREALDTIADYKALRAQLLDVFDDQPSVAQFARNCDTFINGLLYFYTVTSRYGTRHNIVVTKPSCK